MIISSNIPGGRLVPPRPPQTKLVAAVDVEWSKNYRISGGNIPFCYSIAWLTRPAEPGCLNDARFWYAAAYVTSAAETQDLIARAGKSLAAVLPHADLIAGHQLCSDLGVLAGAAGRPVPGVDAAYTAWRQRRQPRPGVPRFLDTRYDAGHILTGASRRLVDVCADLQLDVTQPELRGTSMTALHRRWLDTGDATAREKITVLNLRHSLSTGLVAARAAGLGDWTPGLNVSRLLARELGQAFGYLADPVFTALTGGHDAA